MTIKRSVGVVVLVVPHLADADSGSPEAARRTMLTQEA